MASGLVDRNVDYKHSPVPGNVTPGRSGAGVGSGGGGGYLKGHPRWVKSQGNERRPFGFLYRR